MSNPFATHGAFSWVELHTADVDAAANFYRDVLGWDIAEQDMPSGPYTTITVDGRAVAGLTSPPGFKGPSRWVNYVTVDDVDDRIEKVGRAGGSVVAPPVDVPHVGRIAALADPHGGSLFIFAPDPAMVEANATAS